MTLIQIARVAGSIADISLRTLRVLSIIVVTNSARSTLMALSRLGDAVLLVITADGQGVTKWRTAPSGNRLSTSGLRGKAVRVDLETYSCSTCEGTLTRQFE